MSPLKKLSIEIIRKAVFSAPWGAREALLDACIERVGSPSVLKKLNLVEIAASGDRGVVSSSWRDTIVLAEYAATGTFAKTVTATMVEFFTRHPEGTFMDIGANIGLTTIPIARNSLVHCLAFEPEPTNFDFIKRNVARNAPTGDVEFHQVALWHSRDTLSLAVADGNIGDHRLTKSPIGERPIIEVQALPLDDFDGAVKGPLAIKIDTQGAEPHILAGGRNVFSKANLVAIEFCPFLMKQLNADPQVVLDYLSDFERVAVMPGGRAVEPRYSSAADAREILKEKLRTAIDSDADYLDILASRNDTK